MLGLNFTGTQDRNEQRCRDGDQQELCIAGIKPLTAESTIHWSGYVAFAAPSTGPFDTFVFQM